MELPIQEEVKSPLADRICKKLTETTYKNWTQIEGYLWHLVITFRKKLAACSRGDFADKIFEFAGISISEKEKAAYRARINELTR